MAVTPEAVLEQLRQRLPYLTGILQPARRLDELGLDSLDWVEVLVLLDDTFAVQLPPAEVQTLTTVAELTEVVAARAALEVPQA